MGFNRRYINFERSVEYLKKSDLKSYYGKSDCLIFEDSLSSYIHDLHFEGKKDSEILLLINQKTTEEKNK